MPTLQLKRATAARWVELNPILAAGEPGFEYDTKKLKIGDGNTTWLNLQYVNECAAGILSVEDSSNLPIEGDAQFIYKVDNEKTLYQWNQSEQKYEALNQGSGFDPNEIKLINGGTANG